MPVSEKSIADARYPGIFYVTSLGTSDDPQTQLKFRLVCPNLEERQRKCITHLLGPAQMHIGLQKQGLGSSKQ